jgi:CHAT domain-containing protein
MLGLDGCHRLSSPDETFQKIREEMRRGQLGPALQHVEEANARYRNNLYWSTRFRILRAHVVFLRGSYREGLQLLSEELPPSLAHTEVSVHRQLVRGLAYTYLQQFDQADPILTEAENLAAAIDSSFQGDLAQARGILEIDRKNYDPAERAFRKALSYARQRNLPFLEVLALGNLGNVAMWREHYDEAIDHYRLALEKSQSIGSVSSLAGLYGNMGWNYSTVGDFDLAEVAFKQAREKAEQAGLIDQQIYWLGSLAAVYSRQHRYTEADALSQQAVALAQKQDDQQTLTECLNTRTEIALALGHFDDAERSNSEAIRIEKSGKDQFGIANSQFFAGRIAAGKKNYRQAQTHFQNVLNDPHAETALKWEAHAGLAQVFASQALPARAEAEFRIAAKTIRDAQHSIDRDEFRIAFLSNAVDFYDSYVNFLIDRHRPLDALKVADLTRAQSFDQSIAPASGTVSSEPPLNPQAVSRRWNSTLLFFWLGRQKSWLWVVNPASTSLIGLPAEGEVDALVGAYRDSFTEPGDQLESKNANGSKLYSTLIQPAEKFLLRNGRVVILPDGRLNSLNFETLIAPGCTQPCPTAQLSPQPHYWIDDVTITTANSLSRLTGAAVLPPPDRPTILLVGKALFASPDFPPIGQAGREIGLVENHFPPERRLELTDGNATASAYLNSHPEHFTYIHFNAHGTASRLQPLDSAIVLSPEGDSFKLYARDILKHPLSAYLVTISACNGSGIKTYAGEGLVGLSWAFLRAGAHNVIGGLWEVSNASTPQLMDELYKNLSAGQDAATALRNAKLTLVHSSGNYRRPFYWAPFLLYAAS